MRHWSRFFKSDRAVVAVLWPRPDDEIRVGRDDEFRDSIGGDLREKRWLAFQSRLRQPEELYVRTLYAWFVASDEELPHIISSEMPNGFSRLYTEVNRVVFDGRDPRLVSLQGLRYGTFTPMDTLNDGAHVSFHSFMACIGWALHPENAPPVEGHWKFLTAYCNYLKYMHEMFKEGKSKADVLAGVKNLHRPATDSQSPTPANPSTERNHSPIVRV